MLREGKDLSFQAKRLDALLSYRGTYKALHDTRLAGYRFGPER
jgi:hypothetical protein